MKFLRERKSLDTWRFYADDTGTFQAGVVYFENPSYFGINRGRINKLFIQNETTKEIVCNYDKRWYKKPTKEAEEFYNELLKKLN